MALFIGVLIMCLSPLGIDAAAERLLHAPSAPFGVGANDLPAQVVTDLQSVLSSDFNTMQEMLVLSHAQSSEGQLAKVSRSLGDGPLPEPAFLTKATVEVVPDDSACNPPCISGQGICASRSGAAPRCHCHEPFRGARCDVLEAAIVDPPHPLARKQPASFLRNVDAPELLRGLSSLEVSAVAKTWLADAAIPHVLLALLTMAIFVVGGMTMFLRCCGPGLDALVETKQLIGRHRVQAATLGRVVWRNNLRILAGNKFDPLGPASHMRKTESLCAQHVPLLIDTSNEEALAYGITEVWAWKARPVATSNTKSADV